MSRKLFLLCGLLLLSIQIAFSQVLKNDKKDEELKKEAVIFLRETAMDVGNLRTLENRISFSAEIANLMWFHDASEAQTMFQKVIVDFRQLLMQIDQQFTALENAPAEDTNYDLLTDDTPDAKRKLTKKLMKAVSVRQQIALSIAEHDPQMAFDFFTGTSQAVTNIQLRTLFEANDAYFESKLIYAIADKDVDKALEGGRRRLAKGFDFEIINLLKKIYEKDAAKGITFGEEIVSKVKSESSKAINFYLISTLISAGEENLAKIKDKTGKKPMLGEQSMRELADLLAAEIMKLDGDEGARLTSYIAQVEKFSPSRAVQLRAKFAVKNNSTRGEAKTVVGDYDEPPLIEKPPNKSNSAAKQEEYFKQVQTLGAKPLSKEEKEKVVAQSREIIAKIKSREQKIVALSILASQVSMAGDKDLANEIMNEARNLVNFQPKSYKDYLLIWILTSGYVAADAERAFPLLEDTIARLNEMIAAFIKVGEFMDVNEDIIEGEEVQVGSFGGSMTREMLGGLSGAANTTLIALARTDFARTKTLTEKFDRLEVRILAKMLVLRAILGDKKISEK
jgi:hypothetical protein